MNYPKLILQKGKEVSLLRKHHWVFSGALAKKEEGNRKWGFGGRVFV